MEASREQCELVCQAIIHDGGTARFDYPKYLKTLHLCDFNASPKLLTLDIRHIPVLEWGYGKIQFIMVCRPCAETLFDVTTYLVIAGVKRKITRGYGINANELNEPSRWFPKIPTIQAAL